MTKHLLSNLYFVAVVEDLLSLAKWSIKFQVGEITSFVSTFADRQIDYYKLLSHCSCARLLLQNNRA